MDSWVGDTGPAGVRRLVSMNQKPTTMNTASGTSLATVSRLMTNALCRMPLRLIQPRASITDAIIDARLTPVVMTGQ